MLHTTSLITPSAPAPEYPEHHVLAGEVMDRLAAIVYQHDAETSLGRKVDMPDFWDVILVCRSVLDAWVGAGTYWVDFREDAGDGILGVSYKVSTPVELATRACTWPCENIDCIRRDWAD